MTTDLNVGIDWDNDGFIHFGTEQGDYSNGLKVYYPDVLDYSTYDYAAFRTGTSVTIEKNTTYPSLYHGLNRFSVDTNGASPYGDTAGLKLFSDNTNYPIKNYVGTVDYYFSFYYRGLSYTPLDRLRIQVIRNSGATVVSNTYAELANNWQRLTVSSSLSGADDIYIRIINDAVYNLAWEITGVMFFLDAPGLGITIPTYYNVGNPESYRDNITTDVKELSWSWGVAPYKAVTKEHRAKLKLVNDYPTRKYSHEYSGSPFYGIKPNDLLFRILDIGVSNNTPFYTGYIESYKPTTSIKGKQEVAIVTTTDFGRIGKKPVVVELIEGETTGSLITTILQLLDPNIDVSQIETGKQVINYFGDNMSKDEVVAKSTALQYFMMLALCELGKLFLDAYGRYVFRDRSWLINNTVIETFADTFEKDNYLPFGENFISEVFGICYPRETGTQITLSELKKDITIPPGETRKIKLRYTDSASQKVGGKTIITPTGADVNYTGGTPSFTFSGGGEWADVEIKNDGTDDTVLDTYNIKGLPVDSNTSIEVVVQDLDLQAIYGVGTLTLDLKAIDDPDVAYSICKRVLARFSDPQGSFESITLVEEYNTNESIDLFALEFGDRITITETQTGHSRDYFIVGADVKTDLILHEQKLLLEVAANEIDILVDEDFEVDEGDLTLTDASARFTIGSGVATLASSANVASLHDDNRAVVDGTAVLVRYDWSAGLATWVGIDSTVTTKGLKSAPGVQTNNTTSKTNTWSSDPMNYIGIQVNGGNQLYLQNGFAQYLRQDGNGSTQDLYFRDYAGTGTIHHFRCANLGDVWSTSDHQWADHYDATPTEDNPIIPTQSNGHIFIKWTPITGSVLNLYSRMKNSTDCVEIRFSEVLQTVEVFANGASVNSVAATFTPSTQYLLSVSLIDSTIRTHVDDAVINDTSTTHNQTTKGIMFSINTGSVADLFVVQYDFNNDVGINLLQAGVD